MQKVSALISQTDEKIRNDVHLNLFKEITKPSAR